MKEKLIEFLKDQVLDNIGETRPYIDPDNIEWMAEEIVKLFAIPIVSQQREMLIGYDKYYDKEGLHYKLSTPEKRVDGYLANL